MRYRKSKVVKNLECFDRKIVFLINNFSNFSYDHR